MIDPDLPDELNQPQADDSQEKEDKKEQLAKLGLAIAGYRDEAVKARKDSGIETIWMACEEAYLAIDDLNRADFAGAKWAKPTSMEGPVRAVSVGDGDSTRSKVFIRLTSRYVDMGAAKISEILLPIDDKPFSFDPTPVPELIAKQDDQTPVTVNGQPLMRQADQNQATQIQTNPAAAFQQAQGAPVQGQPAQTPVTAGDLARAKMAKAAAAAEKAEQRIYDWMVESNYAAEMRKVMHDAARIGVGVLKGPFPDTRHEQAVTKGEDGSITLEMVQKIVPAYRWIDPWNLFPHKSCGENIHHGDYLFERDYISPSQLRALKREADIDGHPIYLSDMIDQVLEEGPGKCNIEESRNPNEPKTDGRFEIWYFTGRVKRSDMEVMNADCLCDLPDDLQEVNALVTVVNDSVIRATLNPLESGRYNYHAMPWSRRAGHWAGVGVAEQVGTAQRIVNSGTRALMNNAGKSASTQTVIDQRAIVPADGKWEITPEKLWWLTGEGSSDDVRKMFMSVEFPNKGKELMDIINFGFKMAEEACNIPLISQGQNGPTTPETFGAAELQNNNANTLLRSIAYSVDDCITEPVVRQSYEWLLLDPDVPNDEKGDFRINARGSISMVEKAIQEQTWLHLISVSANPVFGLSPEKIAEQILISKRLDPRKVQLTDEEKAQRAQQPPPVAPAVQAATIREQGAMQRLQLELQAEQGQAAQAGQGAAPDTSLQVAQIRHETELSKAQINQATDLEELRLRREEAREQREHEWRMQQAKLQEKMLEFSQARQQTLDETKKELTDTAMRLSTQKELSNQSLAADLHKHHNPAPATPQVATPPTEPVGRAEPGQAFAQ